MKRIGKYEIRGLLGRGGMGTVYKARLPVVGKLVALKQLDPHPHLVATWGRARIEERFIHEAVAIASVRHPNVVEVLDFDADGQRPFFTMEYYYQSLGMVLGETRVMEAPCRLLRLETIIRYGRQLFSGLARLHRAGIIHRDIKPHNLLLTEEDRIKICDFGLSRLRGESQPGVEGAAMVGSPFYAAPEQERHPEAVDARADLYAAGVVICRMLSGLFPGAQAWRSIDGRPGAGKPWRAFVQRATRSRVEERPPSAEHMLQELDQLEARWMKERDLLCEEGRFGPTREASRGAKVELRSKPLRVTPAQAPAVFACDPLLRPRRLVANDFEVLGEGELLFDRSTGLLWQLNEWPDPMEWEAAHRWIEDLNRRVLAGLRTWRLPTVPEMLSLSRDPDPADQGCASNFLNPHRKWFWTSDRKSYCAAWYVDTQLGYAGWSDRTCRYFVRAVSGA